MLKKTVSVPPVPKVQEKQDVIKPEYTVPWCHVHNEPLCHVERTRPLKGTRIAAEAPVDSGERFTEPERARFPNCRPTDPWVTHYDYCATCEQVRLQWKQTVAVEAKREAEAVERLKKKRHWQDD